MHNLISARLLQCRVSGVTEMCSHLIFFIIPPVNYQWQRAVMDVLTLTSYRHVIPAVMRTGIRAPAGSQYCALPCGYGKAGDRAIGNDTATTLP